MPDAPLPDRVVDLWYALSDQIDDAGLYDDYRRRLPPEEADQESRFAFEKSRLQFVLTRILVRTVLSHYTGLELAAWHFQRNRYGKPSIQAPAGVPLDFNLSHADGIVVCAVTSGRPVGVDVEDLNRLTNNAQLARRYFAPAEVAALEQLPAHEQPAGFLRFWTLKEAFIKAVGRGLSIPLDEFAISLPADAPPAVTFDWPNAGDPADWQFARLHTSGRYQVAVALRLPGSERLAVRVRRTVPLQDPGHPHDLPTSPTNAWTV